MTICGITQTRVIYDCYYYHYRTRPRTINEQIWTKRVSNAALIPFPGSRKLYNLSPTLTLLLSTTDLRVTNYESGCGHLSIISNGDRCQLRHMLVVLCGE